MAYGTMTLRAARLIDTDSERILSLSFSLPVVTSTDLYLSIAMSESEATIQFEAYYRRNSHVFLNKLHQQPV
jgi:hypothetical protein